MNEYIKLGIAFTIGLGAGILASKSFFETKYKQIADEEIASVREAMKYRSGHIIEENSLDDPKGFEERIEAEKDENGRVKLYSSIDNMYDSLKQQKEVKADVDKIVETLHPEDDSSDDCYEISETEYSETALGYDKITLHYYIQDDMLVNADDGDWTNNDLGVEAQELIRESRESNLYFRNDPSAMDYEVIRLDGTYYIDMGD